MIMVFQLKDKNKLSCQNRPLVIFVVVFFIHDFESLHTKEIRDVISYTWSVRKELRQRGHLLSTYVGTQI